MRQNLSSLVDLTLEVLSGYVSQQFVNDDFTCDPRKDVPTPRANETIVFRSYFYVGRHFPCDGLIDDILQSYEI
jgi:hypothetical protein